MKKGKIFVLDGPDGCGKATQVQLLVAWLLSLGHMVSTLDFPRYYNNFFGKLIGQLQADKELKFAEQDPRIVSPLYAFDRFESKPQLEQWLAEGQVVVLDRYVSANQLHQAGKIQDLEKRKKFLELLDTMEHEILGLPRPDAVLYLNVPHHISLDLMNEKAAKKQYSEGEMDEVEKDNEYQLNARKSGVEMIKSNLWKEIQCSDDGQTMLSKEIIHERIKNYCLTLL
jgi:dTMP kinase